MSAICHTKSDDVKAALAEMRKHNYTFPLFQVGQKLYKHLEANPEDTPQLVENKTKMFSINLSTGMIHKRTCSRQGKKVIKAYLVRPRDTGLPLCRSCMK